MSNQFKARIGLEIHAQLLCKSKLFSKGSTSSIGPNTSISNFDCSLPGTLPVINKQSIYLAVKSCLILNCKINNTISFDRKHYFYSDLPNGYQITQYNKPIGYNGTLVYNYKDFNNSIHYNNFLKIDKIQIEQDSGKSIHSDDNTDLGTSLIEIVFSPDLESPYQAIGAIKSIQELLRHNCISNCNMEDGSFRCDVNISLTNVATKLSSSRIEIKNLNSYQRILQSANYEIDRLTDMMLKNEISTSETRGFDISTNTTYKLRDKEITMDYRYFLDPDIPLIYISNETIKKIKSELPELFIDVIDRYKSMGLSDQQVNLLISKKGAKEYFDDVVSLIGNNENNNIDNNATIIPLIYYFIINELSGYLNVNNISFDKSPVHSTTTSKLIKLLLDNQINQTQAKILFNKIYIKLYHATQTDNLIDSSVDNDISIHNDPKLLAESLGYINSDNSISNIASDIESICQQSINNIKNQKHLSKYINGNDRMINYFVGDVMKLTNGKYNPIEIQNVLSDLLNKLK